MFTRPISPRSTCLTTFRIGHPFSLYPCTKTKVDPSMQFKCFYASCMYVVSWLSNQQRCNVVLCAGASDELQQKVLTLTTFNNQLVKQLNDKVKSIVNSIFCFSEEIEIIKMLTLNFLPSICYCTFKKRI